MIELSVMYPEQKDKRFNLQYYMNDHLRLVQKPGPGLSRTLMSREA